MIDPGFVGLRLEPFTTRISRERARSFAAVIGETDPVHLDVDAARAAGHPDLLLAPTMLFGIEIEHRGDGLLLEMGVEPLRVLHAEQQFTYHLPVHAGQDLSFSSVVSDIQSRKSGRLVFISQDTRVTRDEARVVDLHQVLVVNNQEDAR